MKTIAIYPGTFDPITKGHSDLVARATKLFDKIIVAIAASPKKQPLFSLAKRIELAKQVLAKYNNVEIKGFANLLTEFARQNQATAILRGLRAMADFDYELQMTAMNRRLASEIETVFLAPAEQYSFISSTLVREIASLQGDVTPFVNKDVAKALQKMYPNAE